MWPNTFDKRLTSWINLRQHCQEIDLQSCLDAINLWWHQTPWKPYYLHWDDHATWPDPWQLLSDNIFCDLARSLGILYTIDMLERSDVTELCLVQTTDRNLVLVNGGKYILNYSEDELLNIQSTKISINKKLESQQLSHLLR